MGWRCSASIHAQHVAAASLVAAVAYAAGRARPAIRRFIRRYTASIQLIYFNLEGLGEPIRLCLAQAGVPFVDHRFRSSDEFLVAKPSLRYGQVPCLLVDGEEIFQSAAILRYIGCAFDASLYPSDNLPLAAHIDALIDQAKDMKTGSDVAKYKERYGFPLDVMTESNTEKVFAMWRTQTLPRHLSYFESAMKRSSTGWLAGTSTPSIADFFVAALLRSFVAKKMCELPPLLAQLVHDVYALPRVVAFKEQESKQG